MSYIIEDNIDFYDMLYNDNHEILNDDNVCLISNNKLDDNHIKLFCGHTFNYESLYKEIVIQKTRKSGLETTRLKDTKRGDGPLSLLERARLGPFHVGRPW